MPMPAQALLAAAHNARVPAVLSRDAGRYLCNYLCWRARAAVRSEGPRLAAFVHVPPVARTPRPNRPGKRRWTQDDLARAGENVLLAMVAAVNRA
jgi:pyroglutamyl-peptidase